MRELTVQDVEYAVTGGALLGGGGGGWPHEGRAIGRLATELGNPTLATLDEFDDDDLLVTVALVGAPAAKEKYVKPVHYVRAIEMLESRLDRPVAGIITNENGPGTTVNGWLQSAMLGVPVVDAPCNGRAHPTGVMGSIGLHKLQGYTSVQAAVGGAGEQKLEMVVSGSLTVVSGIIREMSVRAGGLVAVARNPVTVRYAREHCAVGGITQTIELGKRMAEAQPAGGQAVMDAALTFLGGDVVHTGVVDFVNLETKGGFDVGTVRIGNVELTFWNEYMTLEQGGRRLATFPDLIMTIDQHTGQPVITAEIAVGREVAVVRVPKQQLKLGAGMQDPELFRAVETTIGKSVISYVFE
ncbi:DUF917 domain-containing protein [Alicyclobacillus macrosporangiidus]|uniref:DUF917 family protein n=1 Tax=Alicyclobacillus macrosporangiidus TaxID=392015 RepID=A0A1I7LI40_9BACL|nr:DUF917 family protein [Alicyclobacillus macrosporangiidus]SFV09351.1 hypothetical protein SAMN05421543_1563 [Alicyclobacillus macrosporangiidus]